MGSAHSGGTRTITIWELNCVEYGAGEECVCRGEGQQVLVVDKHASQNIFSMPREYITRF
jgi:hypothetical protein